MAEIMALVIVGLAFYTASLIGGLGGFLVWPQGLVKIGLNPIGVSWRLRGAPPGIGRNVLIASSVAKLLAAVALVPYFSIGGLLGLYLTAVGFICFYSTVASIALGLLSPAYVGGVKAMFGKEYRAASLLALVVLAFTLQYYILNLSAFLKVFAV